MADPQYAEKGLSKLAHAIRRSTAVHVAFQITEPDPQKSQAQQVAEMLETADTIATWIAGYAAVEEQERSRTWQP